MLSRLILSKNFQSFTNCQIEMISEHLSPADMSQAVTEGHNKYKDRTPEIIIGLPVNYSNRDGTVEVDHACSLRKVEVIQILRWM